MTAMGIVVISGVENAVRSIIKSSECGRKSVVENPEQRDFSRMTEDTPLMMASSRTDLNINHDRKETQNNKTVQDGDFLALKTSYDRQTDTHKRPRRVCNKQAENGSN